jgi:hypothetical protein
MMRYVLGILGAFAVIIIVIVLIFGGHGGSNKGSNGTNAKPKTLTVDDYLATGAKMRLTQEGPVTAKERRNSVQTTVGPGIRSLDVLKGYDGAVDRSVAYDNTNQAYNYFANSLYLEGFTKPTGNATKYPNEIGYCPQGNTYIFELLDSDDKPLSRLWTTTCGKGGSFGGSTQSIITLFEVQFPDYNTQTQGVIL